jgi:hypothetical protein
MNSSRPGLDDDGDTSNAARADVAILYSWPEGPRAASKLVGPSSNSAKDGR